MSYPTVTEAVADAVSRGWPVHTVDGYGYVAFDLSGPIQRAYVLRHRADDRYHWSEEETRPAPGS